MQIIVIQNTTYHFEVAISLYSTFKKLGYNVGLYICDKVIKQNPFDQNNFLKQHNIETTKLEDIVRKDTIGFVVSAYPYCNRPDIIPNIEDLIFSFLDTNKLFFVCHRLKKQNNTCSINNITVTPEKSIYLTPLASSIGVDYLWLTDSMIQPEHKNNITSLSLTIQGDFNFQHRDYITLKQLLQEQSYRDIIWKMVGQKSSLFIRNNLDNTTKITPHENLSQTELYHILNENTDLIVPCISETTRDNDYLSNRYSTNFLYASVLEKPIFAHEVFEKVYKIPGIYYNSNNIIDKFQQLLSLTQKQYMDLVAEFAVAKIEMLRHNQYLMINIINQCLNNP